MNKNNWPYLLDSEIEDKGDGPEILKHSEELQEKIIKEEQEVPRKKWTDEELIIGFKKLIADFKRITVKK